MSPNSSPETPTEETTTTEEQDGSRPARGPLALGLGLAVLVVVGLIFFINRPSNLTDVLREEYQMLRIVPPRATIVPGVIVEVTKRDSTHGAAVRILCDREGAYGGALGPPSESPTVELTSAGSGNQSVELEKEERLRVQAKVQSVQGIALQLREAKVVEYTVAALLDSTKLRSQPCTSAINQAKHPTYIVQAIMQADVSYRVELQTDTSMSAEERAGLMGVLGAESASKDATTLTGQGLTLGVALLEVSDSKKAFSSDDDRLLDANALKEISSTPAVVQE